jgi:cytochrome c5
MRRTILVLLVALAAACDDEPPPPPLSSPTGPVPPDPQRPGDPQRGYAALVNNGYVSCGIPYSAWKQVIGPQPSGVAGRQGHNADIPYFLTAFTTHSGVEVVGPNCLTCHAGMINGQLVIGLGDTDQDLTSNLAGAVLLAGGLVNDPVEKAEYRKFADRVDAIVPFIETRTVGVNSADNLGVTLFAHRDPRTLAWSENPLLELPPTEPVPVDVPPWWRMQKKHAMFYNAAGRGDHARIMMTASALCTDAVSEAQAIDAYFPDVRAFIESIAPPKWPFDAPDAQRVARGGQVFAAHCAQCHGTYGPDESYPNLVIPVDEVGTDPTLAVGAAGYAARFVNWFNSSFYGEIARYAPARGYIAPPLDGIWATAPFLHNGSVPTIEALLDSSQRPRYWTRSHQSTDYDRAALGWNFTPLDHGQDGEPNADRKRQIYDTTLPGYSNVGHTFGDSLSEDERSAVLEYLKTL